MSSTYTELVACADRILKDLGPCPQSTPRLALSGRTPDLPETPLEDLISITAYEQLPVGTRSRMWALVHQRLSVFREHLIQRYWQVTKKLYSSHQDTLPDFEVETWLVEAYENRYRRCLEDIRRMLAKMLSGNGGLTDNRNTRGGFGDRTLRILETAFSYTKSPLSTEIDHLSRLTGLETHQVRTWNKRNRGNKSNGKKSTLRTASATHVQSATQLPIIDGRRVASLPSRKYAPPTTARATRPLPRRNAPIQLHVEDVPLERNLSQESRGSFGSDGTNFSFSSIPSNGGFTGFSYPSAQPPPMAQVQQQPTFHLDPLITATYGPPLPQQQVDYYNPLIPQSVDYNHPYGDLTSYHQPQQMSNVDFETYLNLNIDNLAPSNDSLGYDLEAQIQAALQPSLPFDTTLAPTMSPSEGSPYSDFSGNWFNEFDFGMGVDGEDGEGMELLKVVLDGMSRSGSIGDSPIEKTELYPGMGLGAAGGARSESPETVASFALHSDAGSVAGGSGRQSPNVAGPSTSNSVIDSTPGDDDLSFMFNFDLEPVSSGMNNEAMDGYNGNAVASGSGSGWMTGVLPFDMGEQVMGTA